MASVNASRPRRSQGGPHQAEAEDGGSRDSTGVDGAEGRGALISLAPGEYSLVIRYYDCAADAVFPQIQVRRAQGWRAGLFSLIGCLACAAHP